ncbi:MAG: hypothetical protein IJO26_01660 [Clostridium sp.]|nr:hypothetical protein [Clostridium sp.]
MVTDSNRSESADILYQTTTINVEFNKVQLICMEFSISENAVAGTYIIKVNITADAVDAPLEFTYIIKVKNIKLNDVSTFGETKYWP